MADTHSVASSRASSASTKGRLAATFFSQVFPLFPFFSALQSHYPSSLVSTGLVIQVIQMLAFTINPRLAHGESLGAISQIVYASHLPFWDPTFSSSVTFVKYLAPLILAFAMVYGTILSIVVFLLTGAPIQAETNIFYVWRAAIHSISSVLFIPLMQAFLSQMVCSQDSTTLWALTDQACHSTATDITRIISVVAFILLILATILVQTCLFKHDPESQHLLSRGHCNVDYVLVLWKALSCILFHVMLAKSSTSTWLPMYIFFSGMLITGAVAMLLPYYHQWTNRFMCSATFLTALTGLLVYLCSANNGAGRGYSFMDIDGLIFFSCAGVVWWLGQWVADWRINDELIDTLPRVVDANAPAGPRSHIIFPSGLPVYDLSYQQHRELCTDIADQPHQESPTTGGNGQADVLQEDETAPVVLCPFLTKVFVETDVEVATRFLRCTERLCPNFAKSQSIVLASRIFTKGLTRFRDSGVVIVSFAYMIASFAGKASLALQQAERVNRIETTFPVRYHAFKLQTRLKSELNLRDTTYQRIYDQAKKLHKETLMHMQQFWGKLLSQQVDMAQLTVLSTMITHRRDEGNKTFLTALQYKNNDRMLLTKYAGFLEQVMMEPEHAEQLRVLTKQEMEERKRNAMRGAKGGAQANHDQGVTDLLYQFQRSQQKASSSSNATGRLLTFCNVLFLVALCGGLIIFAFLTLDARTKAVRCVDFAAQTRTLASQGGLYALQYFVAGNTTTQMSYNESITLFNAIDAVSRDLLSMHNLQTIGDERPTSAARKEFMMGKYVIANKLFSSTEQIFRPVAMWDMGYEVVQLLQVFGPLVERATNDNSSILLNSTLTELKSAELTIKNAFDSWIPFAFNVSVDYCVQSFDDANTNATIILSVLYAVSIAVLCSLLGLVSVSVTRVAKLKQNILSLFPLIPPDTLQRIAQQAKERVDSYDEQDQEESNGLPQLQDPNPAQKETPQTTVDDSDKNSDKSQQNQEEALKQRLLTKETNDSRAKKEGDQLDEIDQQTALVIPEFSFSALGVFILLLSGILALCIASLTAAISPDRVWDDAVSRIQNTLDEGTTLDAVWDSALHTLADGTSQSYITCASYWSHLLELIASSVALRPTEMEITLIKDSAVLEDKVQTLLQANLAYFLTNASSTFSQLVDVSTPVTVNPIGDALRIAFVAPKASAYSALRGFQLQLGLVGERAVQVAVDAASKTTLIALSGVVIALAASFALFTALGLYPAFSANSFIFFSKNARRILISVVVLSVTVLALHAGEVHVLNQLNHAQQSVTSVYLRMNDTLDTYKSFSDAARSFSLGGDRNFYDAYFDTVTLTQDEFGFVDLFSGSDVQLQQKFYAVAAIQRSLELISLRLMASATNIADAIDVQGVRWNFAAQSNAVELRAAYPNEPLRYTDVTRDLALPTWRKVLVARYSVFSPYYDSAVTNATAIIESFYNNQIAYYQDQTQHYRNVFKGISVASVVLSATALVLGAVYVIWTVNSYLNELQQSGKRIRDLHGNSLQVTNNSFYLKLVSFGILVLLTATFVVGIVSIQANSNAATNVNAANSREWLVASSMFAGEKYRANLTKSAFSSTSLQRLLNDIRVNRDVLYFGQSAGTYNVPGSDGAQDTLLFSENAVLDSDHTCGYQPAGTKSVSTLFAKGVSSAYYSWQSMVEALLTASTWSEVSKATLSMRAVAMPLLRGIRESSSLLTSNIENSLKSYNSAFVALAAVSAALVLFTLFWVILPLLRQQDNEESGSKLLLRLIPSEVCESVPAIQEFFDSELSGENRSSGSGGETNDTTTIPVIAIDSRGVVLKFNTASESIFGYTAAEVIGNNVSILMPERIGKNHDNYLANYRRTGTRRIIGFDRQVHAKKKSGELFPIELNVKEFKRDNGEYVYIGFAKDITKNLELKGTEELNNLIQEYATVPMIAIDSLGTVLRFNRAAEECFGQQVGDVVNQNIKMLMPEEIAARHDSYLAAYLRTREKHVIDATRRVQGLRKSGEIFSLEISVKEITTSDFGAMSTYLGFCRDLTQDNILDEANRINDEITDLSPVPIVGIDPYGKVLKFSRSAVEVLGYEQSEVLDRNVKMLMPEAVAEQHDGYLEQYRSTGKKKIVGTEREVMVQRKDGVLIPMLALIREVKKEGSSMGTFVGYLVPLTEQKSNAHFKAIDDVIVEMHPVPLVTMTANGTVTRVNKALLHEFGYRREEIIDKNVKMLMPPEVASVHDGYLKRYADTRVPHIIGSSRRVHGRRKNGSTFPVEVKVEEAMDADGKSTFIGFLRNLVTDLSIEQQFLMNNTNLEISPTPMIGIDQMGIIKIFSKAAELCWKRTSQSVVGKNVKILMPQYIAEQHDLYLERYRRTRVKSVVDSVRVAEAVDAQDRSFPIELSVREIKNDSGESFFIAYCRDMTRDGETQQIIHRNSQISDLSPMPLLQIDLYGIVQQFNAAAEAEFGWKREDVIGRNVKMLLPDEISKNHDHYLAQYRKTRVKSVIGSLRRTRAKRKDGTSFAVEISVNEVIVDGDPERNSYIGYIRDITEELRLTKANEVSGVISDLSPNPLVAITKKGSIITFNRAACITFRYGEPSQVLGNNVKILMPEEVAVKHDGYLIAYAKTGQKHVVDTTRSVKAKRNDGTFFPAEISVREIAKEGKESTFLSYIRDCTEEVQMAHATQVSDAIQSLSAIPMIIIDVYGIIKRVNQATLPLFGFDSEKRVVGKNVKILMPDEIAVQHDRFLSNYLSTGVKRIIDTTRILNGKRTDGTLFPAEISVREVKTEDDAMYIGYLRDLTASKQVEEARAVNEAIGECSVVPLIVINAKGIVQMFVPAAEEFFGYTSKEVVGQNIKMLMPEEIAKNHDEYLSEYAKTGIKHIIDSTRIATARLKSGDNKPVSITVKEVPSKTGEGKNYIGYVVDLSNKFSVARAVKIAESVRDMMSVSIISITEEGMVRQFNRAAEEFFGYRAADVLGRNVKMLMPPEVARNHDGYLDTYKKTKVKHVINSSRLVQGTHASGDTLDVELHVSEFIMDGKPNFIAYCTDRKKELELSRSAMINEALVSLSLVPIIAIDSKNRISRFSASAESQFGWKQSEVLGQNVSILMPETVAVAHDTFVDKYRSKGHTYKSTVIDQKIDVLGKRRDGTTFPAELTVKEIRKEGQMSTFVGYIRDITDDLVVRSNAVLCASIESIIPDPIIVINQAGILQSFTPAACKLFGYTKEEVLGQNIKMLMPADIAEQHDGYLKRYMSTGVKRIVDTTRRIPGRKKTGETFELELRVRELVSNNQSYFIGYARDTSRDYDLAIETEVGEALMELNPDAIITINPKGIVIKFNAQAEKLFQFERKQIVGRNVKVLMPDAVAVRHDQYLTNYVKTGIKRIVDTTREVTAEKKTGETFKAEVSVREVRDEKGEVQYFLGYVREVVKR